MDVSLSEKQKLIACAHTCLIVLSALFRQNHQRPDFFGIFSFTQASSVACDKQHEDITVR